MNYLKTILFLCSFMSAFTVFAQENGNINGLIITDDGAVLEDVNILISGSNLGTFSNKTGNFVFSNLSADEYTLIASAIGYDTIEEKIIVESGKTIAVTIRLKKSSFALKEISIKGGALKTRNSVASITSVNLSTIKKLHLTNAQDILNQVPGVEIGAYNQGGVADVFTMRGFSGAGHEGQAAIEVDGVSLNEGAGAHDGYADMNLIIPLNISKVDVYKGPSSVLFGRYGMAGTLAFETRKGGEYQDLSLKGGSFDTFDGQVALGQPFEIGEKTLKTNFAAQLFRTNGFTANSESLKGNLNGRATYNFTDNTDITLSLKGYSGKWDAPGYIPGQQFYDDDRRDKQAIHAENDGGNKNYASERLDVNHSFNDKLRLLVFGYAVQQDYQRFAKYGFEPGGQTEAYQVRSVFAAGANLNGTNNLGVININWVSGLELYSENTDFKSWDTANRVRQNLSMNRDNKLQSFSAFAQAEFDISPYFRPTLGLRFDTYDGSLNLNDPGTLDDKKKFNNMSHLSPKVGFRSTLFPGFDIKSNISNGFILPSGIARYQNNIDLDPSEIWQYEVGVNFAYKQLFKIDLTGFILDTSKEVTETAPGSGVFFNSGKTQRRGLELGMEIEPIERLNFKGAFTYTKTEIKDNINKNLEGKEITNIPRTITHLSLEYTIKSGFGTRVSVRDIGKYATGVDNSFFYGGYTLTDASFFYNFGGRYAHKGQIYVEFNNVFNENYAAFAFDSFGAGGGQSYSPAPLRNFSIGVSYNL